MSELDVKALEANFEGWRQDRLPELEKTKAFERYVIELIFRDADPSDDEIDAGWMGGGDDGGADAVYLVINRRFMPDEFKLPEEVITVDLHIIQANTLPASARLRWKKCTDLLRTC